MADKEKQLKQQEEKLKQQHQAELANSLSILIDTADFAAIKHKTQRRKDPEKTPYINHPLGVANIISQEGGVSELKVLQAAVLHDTVEDTETTLEEIEQRFGPDVRSIVAEVTDDKNLPKMERKRLQVVNAPHKSREAKLVKLADKLYNLRSINDYIPEDPSCNMKSCASQGCAIPERCVCLDGYFEDGDGWTEERATEYFKWAKQVIDGLRGTNEKLEAELDKLFADRNII